MTAFRKSLLAVALPLCAAVTSEAQKLPPVRPLGRVLATSREPLASVSQVRPLTDGRVVVHDLTGRRVVIFDSTFTDMTVIADSTSATGMAYGSRLGGLIAYRADSTLFVDPQSLSMFVIDPQGKIVRTIAAPLPREVNQLIGGPNGTPGFDTRGRLIYRAQIAPLANFTPGQLQMPKYADSSLIVRVDLKTRQVDTIAKFRIPKVSARATQDDNGRMRLTTTVNPMPWTDDWAVLADGRVAVVRGQDYRVDFITADGKLSSAPKMPFDWQRLPDSEKTRLIDSTRIELEKLRSARLAQLQALNPAVTKIDTGMPRGRQRPVSDEGATITMAGGGAGAPTGFTMPPPQFVPLSEIPDYRPAFRPGAARGDADGNLWIRTSKSVNGGIVYDVVNGAGELKERVLVPPGRVIAGFGPGGMVYMGVVDGAITRLERARAR